MYINQSKPSLNLRMQAIMSLSAHMSGPGSLTTLMNALVSGDFLYIRWLVLSDSQNQKCFSTILQIKC